MRLKTSVIAPRPVIGGYVKIGMPGKPSPTRFDHVEIAFVDRDQNAVLLPNLEMMRAISEHPDARLCGGCARSRQLGFPKGLPTRIPVYLTSDSLEAIFPTRMGFYRGRTLYCSGDGESATRLEDKGRGKDGYPVFGPAQPYGPCGPACPDFGATCKPQGKLFFRIPGSETVGLSFCFTTRSWNSIRAIESCLSEVSDLTGGVLRYVPLVMELRYKTVQRKEGGSARVPTIQLFYPGSPKQLVAEARELSAAIGSERAALHKIEAGLYGFDEALDVPDDEIVTDFGVASDVVPKLAGASPEPQATVEVEGEPLDASQAAGDGVRPATPDAQPEPEKRKRRSKPQPEPVPSEAGPEERTPEPVEADSPPQADEPEAGSGVREPDQVIPGADDARPYLQTQVGVALTGADREAMRKLLRETGNADVRKSQAFLLKHLGRPVTRLGELDRADVLSLLMAVRPELMEPAERDLLERDAQAELFD